MVFCPQSRWWNVSQLAIQFCFCCCLSFLIVRWWEETPNPSKKKQKTKNKKKYKIREKKKGEMKRNDCLRLGILFSCFCFAVEKTVVTLDGDGTPPPAGHSSWKWFPINFNPFPSSSLAPSLSLSLSHFCFSRFIFAARHVPSPTDRFTDFSFRFRKYFHGDLDLFFGLVFGFFNVRLSFVLVRFFSMVLRCGGATGAGSGLSLGRRFSFVFWGFFFVFFLFFLLSFSYGFEGVSFWFSMGTRSWNMTSHPQALLVFSSATRFGGFDRVFLPGFSGF